MLNVDKHQNKVMAILDHGRTPALVNGELIPCNGYNCRDCQFDGGICGVEMLKWLLDEYVEPKVDWSKVEVDTQILVSDDGENWERRHFADYYDGRVCAWEDGHTSWSAYGIGFVAWKYAKLAEGDD